MWLLVDDLRNYNAGYTARTYDQAIELLNKYEFSDGIMLDHDLGEEKTGYDVLKYIRDNDIILPDVFQLITSNPVGRQNMGKVLVYDLGYNTINGIIFKKGL